MSDFKNFKILGLQPQICNSFFPAVGKNNFLNKIPFFPHFFPSKILHRLSKGCQSSVTASIKETFKNSKEQAEYIVVAVGSSGILKAKQKQGITFNSDKQDVIDFTKISKLTMCSAQEEAQAIVPASTGQNRHCTCSLLKIL